jgi:hypothetical protein
MKLLPVLCAALALAVRVAAVDNVDAATKLPFSFEGSAMLIFYYTGRSGLGRGGAVGKPSGSCGGHHLTVPVSVPAAPQPVKHDS